MIDDPKQSQGQNQGQNQQRQEQQRQEPQGRGQQQPQADDAVSQRNQQPNPGRDDAGRASRDDARNDNDGNA